MAKNPGCWASALDDCSGRLTAEHVLPVALWEVPEGQAATRENRLRRPLAMTLHNVGEPLVRRELTVRNHTAKVLCEGHNAGTSRLDAEGGLLAANLRSLFDLHLQRLQLPKLTWAVRTFWVSGPLVERWLLKIAINTLFASTTRIGGADAQPGWPTESLVEIVFGRRDVDRATDGRFFVVQNEHNVGDHYQMAYLERIEGQASTFILSHGVFHFGVQLESRKPSLGITKAIPRLHGGVIVHPPRSMRMELTNVEIGFRW